MSAPTQAPILSTPDEAQIFEDPTPLAAKDVRPRYTDEQLWDVYEIVRTAREVLEGGYRRVALQFPDHMLRDAPRIAGALEKEVVRLAGSGVLTPTASPETKAEQAGGELETSFDHLAVTSAGATREEERIRFYILADTSYGSCCVDEIAAEHANASVVVHYGRSCLSPTARLPVIYVFTSSPLSIPSVIASFEATFPEKEEKVLLMADITYHAHIASISAALTELGYGRLAVPDIIHDPESVVPNRRIEESVKECLQDYSVFHISDPPTALLLTLSSRVANLYIYPTTTSPTTSSSSPTALTPQSQTRLLLRRRYALLTRLSTCPIFGILINTLSVKHYLSTVSFIQRLIAAAGKKSYTFVVGKVNPAKVANFAEIGGWVVVGCWESSLVESGDFYRPLITPFELGVALQGDEERVWDGRWEGGFAGIDKMVESGEKQRSDLRLETHGAKEEESEERSEEIPVQDEDSEPESAPPEFDLRTGRYVSHSRPMAVYKSASSHHSHSSTNPTATTDTNSTTEQPTSSLIKRAKQELATINGSVSPGAEFLKSQRTWMGLGSDFAEEASEGIEEGRRGVARGYTVGEGRERT